MYKLVVENRLNEILEFFTRPDAMETQRGEAVSLAKREMRGSAAFALLLIVAGAISVFVGLTGRTYWILVGAVGGGMGLWQLFRLLSKMRSFHVTFESDLVQACRTFYLNAYCKAVTDFDGKEDQIASVLHLVPLPILRGYATEGWSAFTISTTSSAAAENAVSCATCGRSFAAAKTRGFLHIYDDELAKGEGIRKDLESQFLVCQHCGLQACYMCLFRSGPKELRLICPRCGRATCGIQGITERWKVLRNLSGTINPDCTLASVDVSETGRSETNVVDVVVRLSGTPFGEITFRNAAIHVDDKWFLATPEPLVAVG
jgi:transcription elongation factor Elf1